MCAGEEGNLYVRVIDYKSGAQRFDLTSIYYGLQLQLAVYLNAAMELEQRNGVETVHPAGMFYYHIQDPMLDYEEEEDPALRILKELAFNGIVNGDPEIIKRMDKEAESGSSLLPVRFKKGGGYSASSFRGGRGSAAASVPSCETKIIPVRGGDFEWKYQSFAL